MDSIENKYFHQFTDYNLWVYTAEQHLTSATLFDSKIKELISKDNHQYYAFEISSYRGSALLLIGLALENAIKGYILFQAKDEIKNIKSTDYTSQYIDDQLIPFLSRKYGWNKNHLVVNMYEKNMNDVFLEYKEFLIRMQENLIWMGKYSLPNSKYFKDMEKDKDFSTEDIIISDQIISLIKQIVGYYDA